MKIKSMLKFSLLAFDSREHARYFLLLSTFGGFSLFPLIFTGPGKYILNLISMIFHL